MSRYQVIDVIDANERDNHERLFQAISEGSLLRVRWYYWGIAYSSVQAIDSLVPATTPPVKVSKLLAAVKANQPEIVSYLVNAKWDYMDMHHYNRANEGPLKEALLAGSVELVKILLAKFDVKQCFKDNEGNGLLHFVDKIQDPNVRAQIARMLLEKEYDIKLRNDKHEKPAFYAEYADIKAEIEKAENDKIAQRGAFWRAWYASSDAQKQNLRKLNRSAQLHSDFSYYYKNSKLTTAVLHDFHARGLDVRDPQYHYYLVEAAKKGDLITITALLAFGVKPIGNLAVEEAIRFRQLKAVELLFANNAYYRPFDAAREVKPGMPAVVWAIANQDVPMLRFLISQNVYMGPSAAVINLNAVRAHVKAPQKAWYEKIFEFFTQGYPALLYKDIMAWVHDTPITSEVAPMPVPKRHCLLEYADKRTNGNKEIMAILEAALSPNVTATPVAPAIATSAPAITLTEVLTAPKPLPVVPHFTYNANMPLSNQTQAQVLVGDTRHTPKPV
jgi:ankyrin repeat protein